MLRPALEAAVEVARAAASAHPPMTPAGPLRPLLKLRHLPDRALGTVRRVLEEDELFRSVVAAATTEELVGRASWLYLRRPEGWEEALETEAAEQERAGAAASELRTAATARRRLAVVEESLRAAEAAAAGLRQELAEVKDRLAEERRARRAADTEAGRLRRRIADLEGRAATDEVAELRAEVTRLRADVEDARAAAEAAAGDAGPPPAPVVDQEPVQRAVEALDRARHELATWLTSDVGEGSAAPPPSQPEATPRRRPAPLPPATFDDTVEAAEHLVRLPGVVVFVDGYNVTKHRHPERPLPEQRAWLVDTTSALAARCDAEIHVVFDGADTVTRAPAEGPRRASVHVRYTQAGVEADDEILALVAGVPPHRPVVVVTSDRRIREGAAFHGANLLDAGTYVELLRTAPA